MPRYLSFIEAEGGWRE